MIDYYKEAFLWRGEGWFLFDHWNALSLPPHSVYWVIDNFFYHSFHSPKGLWASTARQNATAITTADLILVLGFEMLTKIFSSSTRFYRIGQMKGCVIFHQCMSGQKKRRVCKLLQLHFLIFCQVYNDILIPCFLLNGKWPFNFNTFPLCF